MGWTISGRATLHGDELKGTLVVEGPADRSSVRVHAVLCEKIVMLPGSNGLMLHKHVLCVPCYRRNKASLWAAGHAGPC